MERRKIKQKLFSGRCPWAAFGQDSMTDSTGRRLEVELGDFATERLEAEAERQGVLPEELARHAILYFLADLDTGRIARSARGFEPSDGIDVGCERRERCPSRPSFQEWQTSVADRGPPQTAVAAQSRPTGRDSPET